MKKYPLVIKEIDDEGYTIICSCDIPEGVTKNELKHGIILPKSNWKYTSIMIPSGDVYVNPKNLIEIRLKMDTSISLGDNTYPRKNEIIGFILTEVNNVKKTKSTGATEE